MKSVTVKSVLVITQTSKIQISDSAWVGMRRQGDGSFVHRPEAADLARYAQYYTGQTHQPLQPQQPQRRSRHRSTSSSVSSMPVQQYVYQPGPPMILSRPRDPIAEANDMIDAVCSLSAHEAHNLEWILDLEYGPPMQQPTHRHVAHYDPSKRIIMSASQPNTVHPDFLKCNERFRDMLIESYIRREVHGAALAHAPHHQHASLPVNYHELYRMMEEQKHMQNVLMAASARQAYSRAT